MSARIPRSWPARAALIVAAALILLIVAAQLFLAGFGEGAIEDRLTENGGVAEVSLSATPAARLLWGDGDRLSIRGTSLDLDLETDQDVALDDLDRFDEVEIVLDETTAGPFRVESLVLARDGDEPYSLESRASVSVADLARFGIEGAELPGAGIVDTILEITGVGGADVPVNLDLKMESDEGQIEVVEGSGEVAGLPTGPLVELITAAIALRL